MIKNIILFVGGLIIGFLLGFLYMKSVSAEVTKQEDSQSTKTEKIEVVKPNEDLTLFDEPGDVVEDTKFKVFQALDKGVALASGSKNYMTTYLLIVEGKYFYDNEVVKTPQNKLPVQVGVFKYDSNGGTKRTVPVVMFINKDLK